MTGFDTSADGGRDSSSGDGDPPAHLVESASLLSKKWHPAIVRTISAADGPGFSDLEGRLGSISAKVLTDALEELRDNDIVDRTEVSQKPLRVEYTLTERGRDLETVIDSLAEWGERYLTEDDDDPVVLVADDDRRVAAMHAAWLDDTYDVRTAHDGEETLRELDTGVDVIVLDRRMPGLSGDEVLDWIRSQGYDCRVAVVSSQSPSLDDVDMGFDEYVSKPAAADELRAVVADLVERSTFDRDRRELLALQSKLAVLAAEHGPERLEASEEYSRTREQFETVRDRVDDAEEAVSETLARLDAEATVITGDGQ